MSIAIYHFEAKVITRTTGRTAVGAAAYMSCSEMTSEYDGIRHNYTRKQGLVFEKVYIHDTDRWCAGRETSEWNLNERKSVRAFLERESKTGMYKSVAGRKQRGHDER